jgi:hypothetical protein
MAYIVSELAREPDCAPRKIRYYDILVYLEGCREVEQNVKQILDLR